MAVLTALDFADQMIAQLRVLDPSVSALVGTPERKFIDTVAQALAENQVDLTGLAGALDIDSKYGTNLDRFAALFGFARQRPTAATGYVVFGRNSPAPADISIAAGTTIQSSVVTANGQQLQYFTTAGGLITEGNTESAPVPTQCAFAGAQGNVGSAALTQLVGEKIPPGITSVTNPAAISGGKNAEDDDSYKVRFKNTVFRNLSGTTDQYLALAVSTSFTTKANVIGPVSQYREYFQIPDFDDAGYLRGVQTVLQDTGGVTGQWTTALSAIPYAKDIYTNPTPFVSNGQQGVGQYFYREDVDFKFNYPPVIFGDATREGEVVTNAPNFTFLNVFNPSGGGIIPGLLSVAPGNILLIEYSYLSGASRNSIEHNVYNSVDIYVDGSNPLQTSTIFLPGVQEFTSGPTDPLYMENFRRDGSPAVRPHPGNFFTPLLNSPVVSLPDTITIGITNYYRDVHYWLVRDVGPLHGTIRARDGIEWSNYLGADSGDQTPPTDPTHPYSPTGNTINALPPATAVAVDGYDYDANIVVLQATLEKARQITTDVLCHEAKLRYFKFDVTVIYAPNANPTVVNVAIGSTIQAYLSNQFFGTVIQLSNVLSLIQQVPGVNDVRWTNDLPQAPNLMRVIECDVNGRPLHLPHVDRIIGGSGVGIEIQRLYLPGGAYGINHNFGNNDTFQLSWNDTGNSAVWISAPIRFGGRDRFEVPLDAAHVQTGIRTPSSGSIPGSGMYHDLTVVQDVFVTDPLYPIATFQIVYSANGTPYLPTVTTNITTSPYAYDSDFFLRDDELPSLPTAAYAPDGDTVPGVIIRPRAQNTFVRPGIG